MYTVGNILNRAHIYFQDFWKRFSIFNKAQQLQLNRKQKQIKKRERGKPTWALPVLASPPGSAQPTGLASRRPPPARRTRSTWPATAATRRPTPASADILETSRDATPTPTSPSHPPSLSPSSPSPSPVMAERDPRHRSP